MTNEGPDLPLRYPTDTARKKLATRFALPFDSSMQDWEWMVADGERFEEFIDVFRLENLNDDERFSLMEVMIQCVEDMELQSEREAAWLSMEPLLLSRPDIHRSTVEYWACLDETESEACFRVSGNMREVWRVISA
ncbi:hypothetical protein SDC9_62754 [bioreactor metagenome]|uniref:Uncharacterized protein n=1 Tax=bioreactor metagenome TaxID=1076179 RepID=A0A644XJM7_9ZZZZ